LRLKFIRVSLRTYAQTQYYPENMMCYYY